MTSFFFPLKRMELMKEGSAKCLAPFPFLQLPPYGAAFLLPSSFFLLASDLSTNTLLVSTPEACVCKRVFTSFSFDDNDKTQDTLNDTPCAASLSSSLLLID